MAKFSESARVQASPDKAWATASDLSRLGEWMAMHEAWRSVVPSEITEGTMLTSVVSIKGLRNRITWRVASFDPPRSIVLSGDGVGGTKVTIEMGIRPDGAGSLVDLDIEFSGKLVFGPVGVTIKRALKGDVRSSIEKLADLIG
ncbi:MAG: type II toxin-antitoxin system Rv0910 family toxin [Haloechinothrix sp.]